MIGPDEANGPSILTTDPFNVLVSTGVFIGLIAAWLWLKVYRSVDTPEHQVTGPNKRNLASAALATALALGLGCGGFLLGRFAGRF